jgi:RNA polymerase sigma-70 factor (sigma-E family)
MADPGEFDDFVVARSKALLQAAWLLTGDWQLAEDLLQAALAKSYLAWRRIHHDGDPEGYVRRVLFTTYVTWWRRRWRTEVPTGTLPERPDSRDAFIEVDLRTAVVTALAGLPRRQRAVVVLRYYCDLSEVETSHVLGCSVGTVKSQAAKGLNRLRDSHLAESIREGNPR